MASLAYSSCMWMMVLGVCVSLVVGTDCGKECALCVYHLLGQQSGFSSMTCSPQCDGGLDSQKLRLCQDLLLEEEGRIPMDAYPNEQGAQEAEGTLNTDDGFARSPEQKMSKKYGGFMKRYGGFMSRRSSSTEGSLEETRNQNDEENLHLDILKFLNTEIGRSNKGVDQGGEVVKRYGGFMRRAEGEVAQGDLLEAVLGRGLKKRYGGFMRRVGRPEWLVDSKNEGVMKRASENGGELQKRYGGFMD
ncbi:proenkephalin-A-like [Pelmatolapia mariae]|uniref:proenkephalin-A-like n=1 Tax=Pelmatolapia mariae TaxID=158779 RepID=UPI002FE5B0AB